MSSETVCAEIITIGTELLLGEIVDTNSTKLARALRSLGVDLFRTSSVGDNAERIATAIRESLERAQIVITSGGLGPTIDDATREAIAIALDRPSEFHPELWDQIKRIFARFGREPTENNRRQAYLPQGAVAIPNPAGTAPAFLVEDERSCIIALPGVPAELEAILKQDVLPFLRRKFDLPHVIRTHIIHTAGMGESTIDDRIQDLEAMSNPTVGLAAHAGQVDIRITAKGKDEQQADRLARSLDTELAQRLGSAIYGADDVTIESVAAGAVAQHGWNLVVVECGCGGLVSRALAEHGPTFRGGWVLPAISSEEIDNQLGLAMKNLSAHVGLGLLLQREEKGHQLTCWLRTPEGTERLVRFYGGPGASAPRWAATLGLNLIRKRLGAGSGSPGAISE